MKKEESHNSVIDSVSYSNRRKEKDIPKNLAPDSPKDLHSFHELVNQPIIKKQTCNGYKSKAQRIKNVFPGNRLRPRGSKVNKNKKTASPTMTADFQPPYTKGYGLSTTSFNLPRRVEI